MSRSSRVRHTAQASRLDMYWREWQSRQPQGPQVREIESLKTQYRVSDFITWQREGLLVLNPKFQRRAVWKKGAKSYLIDTIMRGLPIPIIFLRDLRADLKTFKSQRDVVDGQQRIRTILTYIVPALLPDISESDLFTISRSHNTTYAGRGFEDLPESVRQKILDYQFSVHSFNADTDDREILQIFARMNSTGYKLNSQELRNAEFFGEFKQASYELSNEQLNRWLDWTVFTPDQISRMQEVELTSEFFILMMQGLSGRSVVNMDRYYKEYDEDFPSREEIVTRFHDIFDFIETSVGAKQVKMLYSSKSLFYALFATIYGFKYGLRTDRDAHSPLLLNQPQLARERAKPISASMLAQVMRSAETIHNGSAPQPVQRALRGATSDVGSRRLTIQFLAGKEHDPCPPQS